MIVEVAHEYRFMKHIFASRKIDVLCEHVISSLSDINRSIKYASVALIRQFILKKRL
jgi:hypothetical protein